MRGVNPLKGTRTFNPQFQHEKFDMKKTSLSPTKGLLFKITLLVSVLLIFSICISMFGSIKIQTKIIKDELIGKSILISRHLSSSVENAFSSSNWQFLEKQFKEITSSKDIIFLTLLKPDGKEYLTSGEKELGKLFHDKAATVGSNSVSRDALLPETGEHIKIIITPIELGKGRWHLLTGVSMQKVKKANIVIFRDSIYYGSIIFLVGVLLSFRFARYFTKPITNLMKGTKEIAKGNLDHYIAINSNDEIGMLANSFNEMTQELKNSMTSRDILSNEIAERTQVELALRNSEENYRLLVKHAPAGIAELELKTHRFLSLNDVICEYCGYKKSKLLSMKFTDLLTDESRQAFLERMSRMTEGRSSPYPAEYNIKGNNNKILYVVINTRHIYDKRGKPSRLMLVVHDISDIKQAEQKLRKSEEKYRNILENMEDGYVELDLEGNFTFVNSATCKFFGYEKKEMLGMNYSHFMDEDNAKQLFKLFDNVYKTGIPSRRIWFEIARKDGKKGYLELSVVLMKDQEGKIIGFREFSRDISEKMRADELQQAKAAAEAANEAKSEFLAKMSHEIRTPLNGIIGMTELVMDTELNENQKSLLSTLNTEANSLLDLINDILDFSKIESGKLELEVVSFDLRALVEGIAKGAAMRAEKKGLELLFFLSSKIPPIVEGDPGRLRQILVNLLDNAIKFTQKGEIHLLADLASAGTGQIEVSFQIKDTGIGISTEEIDKIFESFTQADSSTTRKYGGSGLGTTISKQLVELMGGDISVESEEGKGTTFRFSVSFKESTEGVHIPKTEYHGLAGLTVLVIEDNETNKFILSEYLKSWGCHCVEASGRTEALDVIQGSSDSGTAIDLIITDINMPSCNGFELAEEIKTRDGFDKIPIIALTSATEKGDSDLCIDIGINGYFSKPVRKNELNNVVRSVLGLTKEREPAHIQPVVTRQTMEAHQEKTIKVLLVEDYQTNQEVAMRHLLGAGFQVDLAQNGLQAVELFKKGLYDVVLMDIQMPVMDGYEATEKIRRMENEKYSQNPGNKTPIIAMTAHALKSDEEKCMSIGMNDFITKPLRKKDLTTIVNKWAVRADTSGKRGFTESIVTGNSADKRQNITNGRISEKNLPFVYEEAVKEFDGDKVFLDNLLKGFLENLEVQIVNIRAAINHGDFTKIWKEAHKIKGGAANLTAKQLAQVAHDLVDAGKSRLLDNCHELIDQLEQEMLRLKDFLS